MVPTTRRVGMPDLQNAHATAPSLIGARYDEGLRKVGTTMTENIADKTRRLICQQLDVDEARLTPAASFVEDLGADSLSLVQLTLALEEEFEIEIGDEDAERLRTLQDVIVFIEAAVEGGAAGSPPS